MKSTMLAISAAALMFAATASAQQQDFSKVDIKTTDLGNKTYMLAGSGGNITVAVGADAGLTAFDLVNRLQAGDPIVCTWEGKAFEGQVRFYPDAMADGEAAEIVAAVRAACRERTQPDLTRLREICAAMAREAPNAPSARWHELDWQFHQVIVEASGNERFINDFDLLMLECNYVFYRLPHTLIPAKSRDHPLLSTLVRGVVAAHREIARLIAARDTEGAAEAMRLHLAGLSNRVHRDVVKTQLAASASRLAPQARGYRRQDRYREEDGARRRIFHQPLRRRLRGCRAGEPAAARGGRDHR